MRQHTQGGIATVLCIAAVLLVSGATTVHAKNKPLDCRKKFHDALEAYNKGKHARVQEILAAIKFDCSGHEVMDSIIYYLGRSYLALNQPLEAQVEFKSLKRDYPRSPFYDAAAFYVGYCSWEASLAFNRDQSETREAIEYLRDYINTYQGDGPYLDSARKYLQKSREKLARKEFKTGELYEKLNEYEAAVIYFQSVIDKFPETDYADEARLRAARNMLRLHRDQEARRLLESLIRQSTHQELVQKARQLKKELDGPSQ